MNGPVKQIWFGEPELGHALAVANVGGDGKRFAQAQEVVGLVVHSDKAAGQAAYAAGKSNAVLAFLSHLQCEVHRGITLVLGDGRILFRLELLEVSQLVQP